MSSVLSVDKTKHIDSYNRDIVTGFMRNFQHFFSFDIPPLVSHWVLLYHSPRDFFPLMHGLNAISISNACTIAEAVDDLFISSTLASNLFISQTEREFVYVWQIKIITGVSKHNYIDIGLSCNRARKTYLYCGDGDKFKLIWNAPSAHGGYRRYGQRFGNDDIITVRFEVGKGKLEFYRNHWSQGVAFDDITFEDTTQKYRLVIFMPCKGMKVELVNFNKCIV